MEAIRNLSAGANVLINRDANQAQEIQAIVNSAIKNVDTVQAMNTDELTAEISLIHTKLDEIRTYLKQHVIAGIRVHVTSESHYHVRHGDSYSEVKKCELIQTDINDILTYAHQMQLRNGVVCDKLLGDEGYQSITSYLTYISSVVKEQKQAAMAIAPKIILNSNNQ